MAQLVKVVDGLAIASTKTVSGLAIATVKTVNGLDNTSSGLPQTGAIIRQLDDTGIPGNDGDALTTWTKVVGPGNFTGTATVKKGANGLNSLPVALFNGTTDILAGGQAPGISQPVTIAMVYQFQVAGGNHSMCNPAIHIWELAGVVNGAATTNQVTSVTVDTNWHKFVMVFNGASSTYAFDGAAPTTFGASPGTVAYASSGSFYEWLGAFNNGSGGSFFANIKIAAYYAWNVGLTSGEQTTFSTYISSKYGI